MIQGEENGEQELWLIGDAIYSFSQENRVSIFQGEKFGGAQEMVSRVETSCVQVVHMSFFVLVKSYVYLSISQLINSVDLTITCS